MPLHVAMTFSFLAAEKVSLSIARDSETGGLALDLNQTRFKSRGSEILVGYEDWSHGCIRISEYKRE